MDVTIYYTQDYRQAPNGIERISTPLESGWDRNRVYFSQIDKEAGTWCLMVESFEKPKNKELGWYHYNDYLPLKTKCGSMAGYGSWLEQNVSLIEVDGRTFWANPSLAGGDEQWAD